MASFVRVDAPVESGGGGGGGEEPDVNMHLPRRSKLASSLGAVESGGRRRASMVGDELDQNSIKDLLCNANLRMPEQCAMKKMGTVSVKQSAALISCLIFQRDGTS